MKPITNEFKTLICPKWMTPVPQLGLIAEEDLKPLPLIHPTCRCIKPIFD